MPFELGNAPSPAGDQPRAIGELTAGLRRGDKYQTLVAVPGSGKSVTMGDVVIVLPDPVTPRRVWYLSPRRQVPDPPRCHRIGQDDDDGACRRPFRKADPGVVAQQDTCGPALR